MAENYWKSRNKAYVPGQKDVFKVSRSKIELFTQCPRCFWLDARLKIKRPSGPPFNINKTIDELFKKEFDVYRTQGKPHPMMTDNQINAIPYAHADLDTWRANFTGVSTLHEPTNLHVFGAVDDIWINDNEELIVVDYKATSKASEINIDSDWQMSYKRQMEIYQWLLRANGFKVSDTAYFVYTNARVDLDGFHDRVEFVTKVIPYTGDANWVEPTLAKMKSCLEGDIPAVGTAAMGGDCDYCMYARSRTELTIASIQNKKTVSKL
ncbi:MAG: PD-(D/E)XK nuclease family protein [Patescibacteria group bacterium]